MAATEQDQVFVEYVVKAIVDHPQDVVINRTVDERGVLLELTVNPEDMGKVIGKAGATAKSIRTLLRVLGAKDDARYNLKIVDVDGGEGRIQQSETDNSSNESAPVQPQQTEQVEPTPADAIKAKAREGIEDLDTDI